MPSWSSPLSTPLAGAVMPIVDPFFKAGGNNEAVKPFACNSSEARTASAENLGEDSSLLSAFANELAELIMPAPSPMPHAPRKFHLFISYQLQNVKNRETT